MGVHAHSKHPVEYQAATLRKIQGKENTKKRWSADEVARMARKEAEIREFGEVDNINQELKKLLPDRLNLLTEKGRSACYKNMVADILTSITEREESVIEEQISN